MPRLLFRFIASPVGRPLADSFAVREIGTDPSVGSVGPLHRRVSLSLNSRWFCIPTRMISVDPAYNEHPVKGKFNGKGTTREGFGPLEPD